jgi:type IV pilus assembly protein PilY1
MKRTTFFLLSVSLGLSPSQGKCALLNLYQSPLFLGTSVPANVFIQLDDSGSMDWEFMMKGYWESCAYDPNITGAYSIFGTCGTFQTDDGLLRTYGNGNFRNFSYFYANSENLYSDGCSGSSTNSIEACPSAGTTDWRAYNAALNAVYYDPTVIYAPWIGNCSSGTACANASFTAARNYPVSGQSGYSTTRNLAGTKYDVWIDDHGYSGTRPLRAFSLNITNGANGVVDLWDSHITVVVNAANAQIYSTTYAPTNAGLNPTQTLQATLTGGACFNALGPPSLVTSIFNGTLSYNSTGGAGCMTLAQAQQNIANWYQYSRRRSFGARGAVGSVIDHYPNFRYGLNTINDNLFIEVPASNVSDFTAQNASIISSLLNFTWPASGTPLRSALGRVGRYYSNSLSGKANTIIQSCQQNYAILITDGYWNDGDTIPSGINDVDGDGISQTLADVANYYYKNDLNSSLANNVIPNGWDTATWQHMVTFTMGFGITGNLVAGSDGWPNPPLAINGNWGNPFSDYLAKVDDLWHAAYNSKGTYLGAQNPATAGAALANVLSNITQRSASAVPVAQNSTTLNVGSQIFQAIFDSNNWSGDVLAYPISLTGVISTTPTWSAGCLLTGGVCALPAGNNTAKDPNSRVIITRNFSGATNGIAFRWPSNYTSYKVSGSLPAGLAAFLANAPYNANTTVAAEITANQAYGQALLNYLRGDRSQETQYSGTYGFRNRSSVLGDITESPPIYVPPPYRNYSDSMETASYSAFKQTYANRTSMVYAGANDGMLHGFNATNGQELIAYIPGALQIFQNLPNLSISPYAHVNFVDGIPVEADVFYNSAWHTILVSSLGTGGQSIFAIDITNPANFSESNASQVYLWEFSDQNDADLGYITGKATIAKVKTGTNSSKWAVIFGNGYNNSKADGYASTNGKAALFILFIEGGANGAWTINSNYIKIPVGTGSVATPNGLSTPFAVDINNDFVVDYVYAGDLQGNMWRFNLTDSNPSNWAANTSLLFTASNAAAGDQPITASPIVGPHPTGIANGVMVYFGTGQYLQPTDNSSTGQVTQSFYAIWDKMAGATVNKSALVQQQILGVVTVNSNNYRVVTNNTINWNTTPSPQNLGWYINLIESTASSNNGERQISQPILRNNNLIFSTILPSTNPCQFGGSSWIMEVNSASGGSPMDSPFDTNNDGSFTAADYLTITVGGNTYSLPSGGIQSSAGLTGSPTIFMTPDKTKEVKVLSGSQGLSTFSENPGSGPTGRQNWRQLY